MQCRWGNADSALVSSTGAELRERWVTMLDVRRYDCHSLRLIHDTGHDRHRRSSGLRSRRLTAGS